MVKVVVVFVCESITQREKKESIQLQRKCASERKAHKSHCVCVCVCVSVCLCVFCFFVFLCVSIFACEMLSRVGVLPPFTPRYL